MDTTATTGSTSIASNKRRRTTTEITDHEAHNNKTTNYIIPSGIDIIDAQQDITSSKYFYEQYIALRKPCIIINANDPNKYDDDTSTSNTTAQRIVKELLHHPETMVQVERRCSTQERFGQSRRDTKQQQQRQVTMSISSFVKDICHIQESISHHTTLKPNQTKNIINSNHDEPNETSDPSSTSMLYYLSTQEEPSDVATNSNIDDVNNKNIDTAQQEHPLLELQPPPPYYGPPCDILHSKHLLPTLPQSILAGNLYLYSINLWMGYTPKFITPTTTLSSSSSTTTIASNSQNQRQQHSGLHFDYHDNFYTLLHGEKTFYLYPPNCAPYLMLQGGTIDTIHTNGLISFAQSPVGADGRSSRPERIHHHQKPAAISTSNTAHNNDDDSEEEDEEEEEVVLGKGFDYASSNDDDNEDGTDWHLQDDTDHKDDYNDDGDDYSDDEVDDDKLVNQKKCGKDIHDTNTQGNATLSMEEMWLPPNFSWIDPIHTTREQIIQTFPIYAQCPIEFPCKVTLLPNQCLYLPASWLHCVISSGGSNTDDKDELNCNAANTKTPVDDDGIHIPSAVHMAINSWYHPPDNLNNYDHPYTDRQFWERSLATKDKK